MFILQFTKLQLTSGQQLHICEMLIITIIFLCTTITKAYPTGWGRRYGSPRLFDTVKNQNFKYISYLIWDLLQWFLVHPFQTPSIPFHNTKNHVIYSSN